MIVVGVILLIAAFISICYSIEHDDDSSSIILLLFCMLSAGLSVYLIGTGIHNSKSKAKEIKNVKYYDIKSTIIIEDNIPVDTIYTIYYKKK